MAHPDPAFIGKASVDTWIKILNGLYDAFYTVDVNRQITFWNRGAEAATGYSAAETLGKGCFEGLLCHCDDRGRELCNCACPLAASIESGLPSANRVFLKQRDGARLPVRVQVLPLIASDGKIFGAAQIFTDDSVKLLALEQARKASRIALLDELTGLGNRRLVQKVFRDARKRSGAQPAGLFLADIDFFKQVNDGFGHDAGDAVLQMVAKSLKHCLRDSDVAARWGGEEFLVVLPGSSLDDCRVVAERVLNVCRAARLKWGERWINVTLSIGVTSLRRREPLPEAVARADRALYESKRNGRNRVTLLAPAEDDPYSEFAPAQSQRGPGSPAPLRK